MIAPGLEEILSLQHPEAVKVFSEQMLELHRGQGMEIYWRDNFHCPTEEEYKQMTIRKTGKKKYILVSDFYSFVFYLRSWRLWQGIPVSETIYKKNPL